MKTAIMTDTNSGISIEEGRELGIYVLPMPILIDDECYLESIDITVEQLFEAMESDKNVSTSQPSPGDVIDMWNLILDEGYDEIVHIPMTSGLSGSCQSAMLFAEDFDEKVQVVDNHRISVTQREAALEAKRMADSGKSAKAIKTYLEDTALQASIYIAVDSLKYLQRGGRLSASAATLGTLLNIKPILSIQGEKLDAFAKMRGAKQCERKMIEALKNDIATRFSDVPEEELQVATAGTLQKQEDIDHWLSQVQNAFPNQKVYYASLPCSISTHLGPECKGIGVVLRK